MSLFLNALKTLADRPEPGFPAIDAAGDSPADATSPRAVNTAVGQGPSVQAQPPVQLVAKARAAFKSHALQPQAAESQTVATQAVASQEQPQHKSGAWVANETRSSDSFDSESESNSPSTHQVLAPIELLAQLMEGSARTTDSPDEQTLSTPPASPATPTTETPEVDSQDSVSTWSNIWRQAVANPTPIEMTQDAPESPEDIALADLAEMTNLAETASTPWQTASDMPEEWGSADTERSSEAEHLTETENSTYSQEMKFIFAPWFEAHTQASDAEPKSELNDEAQAGEAQADEAQADEEQADTQPETLPSTVSEPTVSEPTVSNPTAATQKVESYWGSEAFDPYAGLSTSAETTSAETTSAETTELSAFETPSPTCEHIRETLKLPESAADLFAEVEAKVEAEPANAEEETWTLYDRTAEGWSENLSTRERDLAQPVQNQHNQAQPEQNMKEAESVSIDQSQGALAQGAESTQADSEPEIPSYPIPPTLASFAVDTPPATRFLTEDVATREEVAEPRRTRLPTSHGSRPVQEIRVTEPYLRLATRLSQTLGASRPQAIAIAAVDKLAGKALNLAQLARALTLVEEGDVLVVQGSEARPELAWELGVLPTQRPSWANTGGGDLAERIICNPAGQLAMLPQQSLGGTPSQLVDPLLLARCKRHYSLILVEVGDLSSETSQSLISQVDIGLLTAILHHTTREAASQSAALLRRLGVRISGCVLSEARSAA